MDGLTAPAQGTRSSAYLPLARKYRPSKFSDMVGQDATAQAIANAIRLGRQPQAVIFAGVRGVGKTTTARLYAKALNCSLGVDFEKCSGCESCLAIAVGNHEDVMEIDGASNTGVDDVRALRETVGYVPQRSKFKVYIIDEVHMLSQSAFNALLKTLEEPPAHVVFVFATTELAKIPRTIQSRCQIFQLQKISAAMIASRIESVLKAEAITADPRAVAIIAREGHGSMRDALTLTDHVLALGNGVVSLEAVREVVVQASSAVWLDLLAALARRDVSTTLSVVQKLDQEGVEFIVAAEELARFARHGFVLAGLSAQAGGSAPVGHELAEFFHALDDAELARLREIVSQARPFDLNRIFRTFVQCRLMMDGSGLDRWIFENHAIEWCLDPGLPDLSQLNVQGLARPAATSAPGHAAPLTAALPSRPQATVPQPLPPQPESRAQAAPQVQQPPVSQSPQPPQPKMPVKGEFPVDWNALIEAWKRLKPLQARKLEEVHPLEYGPGKIVLGVPQQSFAGAALLGKDEQQRVKDQFAEMFGFKGTLQVVSLEASRAPKPDATRPVENVPQQVKVPAEALPESVLETREREKNAERGRVIQAARDSALTKEALAILGGKIEDIKVTDPSLT
jgi:DNA polymerase-3 subunit gamma/tau